MGEGSGGVLNAFQADISLSEALEIHAEGNDSPPGHLVIGTGGLVYADISLDLNGEGPAPVMNVEGNEVLHPIASSLPALLHQQAFLQFELEPTPRKLKFGVPHGLLELADVRAALSRLGFAYRSFSDETNLCGFQGEMRVGAFQLPRGHGWITLGGVREDLLASQGTFLSQTLGLRPGRPSNP
jgi:hypothetical protein